MPDASLVIIHGIGNQKKAWSGNFRTAMKAELGSDASRVLIVDAWWAPLSTLKEDLSADARRYALVAFPLPRRRRR